MSRGAYRLGAYVLIGASASVAAVTGCEKQSVPVRPSFDSTFEIPPLEVHSVTPTEGLAGDEIMITGLGFEASAAANRAYIGGAGVDVVSATDSTMTLRVPVWASSGPIRVTDQLGWRSATSSEIYEVKAPDGLPDGYTGVAGQPTITSAQPDQQSVGAGTTTTTISGTVSGSDGDGYWAIVENDGTVRSMGRLTDNGGTYTQTIPIFCGTQYMLRFFSNSNGRAYYRTTLDRTGCTEPGMRVQLAWDIDVTDVDLHLLKPGGSYRDSFSDCYYANPNPDWGVEGDPADNPELDVDDVNGYGPENIYLDPSEDGNYRVIVHYYSDDGQGPSVAWIAVYIDGQREGSFGPHTLTSTGATWQVADIDWPSGTATAVD